MPISRLRRAYLVEAEYQLFRLLRGTVRLLLPATVTGVVELCKNEACEVFGKYRSNDGSNGMGEGLSIVTDRAGGMEPSDVRTLDSGVNPDSRQTTAVVAL